MAAISQTIFSDAFSWMKSFVFWSKFHWVQLTITQHWLAPCHYLNQCWPDSLTHVCGIRGKWVEMHFIFFNEKLKLTIKVSLKSVPIANDMALGHYLNQWWLSLLMHVGQSTVTGQTIFDRKYYISTENNHFSLRNCCGAMCQYWGH